jgi:sugar lactone lactonase YvrE
MKNLYSLSLLALLFSCASAEKVDPPKVVMLSCPAATPEQAPKLLWTNSDVTNPESVVYDKDSRSFFVSNVVGSPVEKDGKGWITKISSKGKTVKAQWASGLNAPKGLGLRANHLWVADIDQVVAFQTRTGKKTVNITIDGAKFLNDVSFSPSGSDVLVSDMMDNKIYAIQKTPSHSVYAEGRQIESPNGLTRDGKNILVAAWGNDIQDDFSTPRAGRILSIDSETKKVSPWTEAPLGNLDGLEMDGPDAVIVSDWMAGKVFRLKRDGSCVTLLEGVQGTADLGFVPETRTLVVPAMSENVVRAYTLPTF